MEGEMVRSVLPSVECDGIRGCIADDGIVSFSISLPSSYRHQGRDAINAIVHFVVSDEKCSKGESV